MRDHEIAVLKRRVRAYEEADTIDQFKAAINRAREAEGLLAQARKRDTMLDDMCNLIDERDILLAEKALLESERDALKAQLEELKEKKGSIYISDDYTVWGSSDSINRLSDHLDDLEDDIKSLKASELAHRLLYERTKEQNTLLVGALEKIRDKPGYFIHGGDNRHWSAIARQALAAVKEADKSAKEK